jgi:hypothetical protein
VQTTITSEVQRRRRRWCAAGGSTTDAPRPTTLPAKDAAPLHASKCDLIFCPSRSAHASALKYNSRLLRYCSPSSAQRARSCSSRHGDDASTPDARSSCRAAHHAGGGAARAVRAAGGVRRAAASPASQTPEHSGGSSLCRPRRSGRRRAASGAQGAACVAAQLVGDGVSVVAGYVTQRGATRCISRKVHARRLRRSRSFPHAAQRLPRCSTPAARA